MTTKSLEHITQITVEIHHGTSPYLSVGTGIVYSDRSLSGQVYVLTAKHCLSSLGEGETVSLRVFNQQSHSYEYVCPRNQRILQSETEDAAIIVFNKRELGDIFSELPTIYVVDCDVELGEAVAKGFPYAYLDQESERGECSLAAINMRFLQDTHVEHYFQFSTTDDYTEDTISGMSGSGIFIEVDEELYLTGILTRFSGEGRGKVIWSQRIAPFNNLLDHEFKRRIPTSFLGHHGLGHKVFINNVSDSVANLGPRYCRKVNVRTGTAKYFECLAKTPAYYEKLAHDIDGWITENSYRRREKSSRIGDIELTLNSIRSDFTTALNKLEKTVNSVIDFSNLIERVERLKEEIDRLRSKLYAELGQMDKNDANVKDIEADESRLSEISRDLYSFDKAYSELKINMANKPYLIISGEAGCGKSHLLGDVACRRISEGLPTLLFIGTDFTSASYESAILSKTGFSGSFEEFLASLNQIGMQIGSRALILIDALNEGKDASRWKDKLPGFINAIKRFPAIGLAVSVRDTYFDDVIPSGIEESLKATVIKHTGFKGLEYEAVKQFCVAYGFNLPNVPVLNPEFCNPLLLKIVCDTLEASGEKEFPKGFNGVSNIFSQYYKTLDKQFAHNSADYKHRKVVSRAIELLAIPIFEAKHNLLKLQDAESLLLQSFPTCNNLLADLIDNNVLLKAKPQYRDEDEDYVIFSYQRIGDYIIAKEIVKKYTEWEAFVNCIYSDQRLRAIIVDQAWAYKGILDALAILLPETYGHELTGCIPHLKKKDICQSYSQVLYYISEAEINSLTWRSIDSIDRDNIRSFLNSDQCRVQSYDWYHKLAELSVIVNHPFNADYFHALMMRNTMKERDGKFQFFFNECAGYDDNHCALPLRRLIDWAWSEDISDKADRESARLAAIMLCWLLSSTHIKNRDEATKSLVNLLTEKVDVLIDTMHSFEEVDDMYIYERLYAVAYGVALRTSSGDGLSSLARYVYEHVFKHNNPPKDVLLRDYARNIIEYACYKVDLSGVNMTKVRPPYSSVLPDWPEDDSIEYLHVDYDDPQYEEKHGSEQNMIWESVKGGLADFWNKLALPAIEGFCPISIREEKAFAKAERMFKGSLKTCARLYSESKARDYRSDSNRKKTDSLDSLRKTLYEALERMLSKEQLEAIHSIMIPYKIKQMELSRSYFKRFPAEGVRNWVVKRAYELGYDSELHGQYDHLATEGTFRHSDNRIDRVGKKYQWIAFHEVMGILADNFKYEDRYANNGQGGYEIFHGPWQAFLRNINPSMISRATSDNLYSDDDQSRIKPAEWYDEESFDNWNYPDTDMEWASMTKDLPDPRSLIQKIDDNGTEWLTLNNSRSWDEPKCIGKEKYQHNLLKHEVSLFADAILVRKEDLEDAISDLSDRNLWDGIEFGDDSWQYLVNREKYWSPAYKDVYRNRNEWNNDASWLSVPFIYSCEKACGHIEGDKSGTIDSYSIPCRCLFDGLGMGYCSKDGLFIDQDNQIIAITYGYDQILVRKEPLLRYLAENNLAIVWIVRGEKRVYVSGGMGCIFLYNPCGVFFLDEENNPKGELKMYRGI